MAKELAPTDIQTTHFVHGLDQVPHHAKAIGDGVAFARSKTRYDASGFAPMPEIVVGGGNQAEQELTGPWATSAIETHFHEEALGVSMEWLSTLHAEAASTPEAYKPFWDALSQTSDRNIVDPGKQNPSIPPFVRLLMRYSWAKRNPRTSFEYGLTTSRDYLMINGAPAEGQVPMSELRRGEEMVDAYGAYLYHTYLQARTLFTEGSKEQHAVDTRWRQAHGSLTDSRLELVQEKGDDYTFTDLRTKFGEKMAQRLAYYAANASEDTPRDEMDTSLLEYMSQKKLGGLIMGDQTGGHFEWDGALKQMNVQAITTGTYEVPLIPDSYHEFTLTLQTAHRNQWRHVEATLRYPNEHRQAYNNALQEADAAQHLLASYETTILINTASGRFALQQRRHPTEKDKMQFAFVQKDERKASDTWITVDKDIDMEGFAKVLHSNEAQDILKGIPVVSQRAVAFLPSLVYAHDGVISAIGIQSRGSSYKGTSELYAKYQRELVTDERYRLPTVHVPGPKFDFWGTMNSMMPDSKVVLSKPWQYMTKQQEATAAYVHDAFEPTRQGAISLYEQMVTISQGQIEALPAVAARFGADEKLLEILKEKLQKGTLRPDSVFTDLLAADMNDAFTEESNRAALLTAHQMTIATMEQQVAWIQEQGVFEEYLSLLNNPELKTFIDLYKDTANNYERVSQLVDIQEGNLAQVNRSIRELLNKTAETDLEILVKTGDGALEKYSIDFPLLLEQARSHAPNGEAREIYSLAIVMIGDHMKAAQDRAFFQTYVKENYAEVFTIYERFHELTTVIESPDFQHALQAIVIQSDPNKPGITTKKLYDDLFQVNKLISEEQGKTPTEEKDKRKHEQTLNGLQRRLGSMQQTLDTIIPNWQASYDIYAEYLQADQRIKRFLTAREIVAKREEMQTQAVTDYNTFKDTIAKNREAWITTDTAYQAVSNQIKKQSAIAQSIVAKLGHAEGDEAGGLRQIKHIHGKMIDMIHASLELKEWEYKTGTVLAHISADIHDVATADWGNTRASAFTTWLIGGEPFVWKLATTASWQYDQVY